MNITYEIPAVNPPKKNEAFLDSLTEKFPKMFQRFLTVFEKAAVFVKPVYKEKTRNGFGTSQGDHECGSEGERYKSSFSCPFCCLEDYNADLNASIRLVERGVKSHDTSKESGPVS